MANETEKRLGDTYMYNRRGGKGGRRKQRDDKGIMRSEEVDGYRGNDDVDAVLAFIEGTEPPKKSGEEPVKRIKKKSGSGGAIDQGNCAQKAEVEKANTFAGFVGLQYAPKQKKIPQTAIKSASLVKTAEKRGSIDRSVTPKQSEDYNISTAQDEALAQQLQAQELAALQSDLSSSTTPVTVTTEKEKFTTVNNRKPKQTKSDTRGSTTAKKKRATTPPPQGSQQKNTTTGDTTERQRRNSYDFSNISSVVANVTTVASTKKTISSSSRCSQTKIGNSVISQTVPDSADSEPGNVSFSSVDGESAAGKLSYANVAAAVNLNRSNQEMEKTKEIDSGLLRSEKSSLNNSPCKTGPNIPNSGAAVENVEKVDIKNCDDFPLLSSASDATPVDRNCVVVNEEKCTVNQKEPVSMPPAKADLENGFERMDFTYTPCGNASNDTADSGSERPAVEHDPPPVSTGNKHEVLQMLFDSCKNGKPFNYKKQISVATSSSSVASEDRISAPPVQFVGAAAPRSRSNGNSAIDFNFIFGDDDVQIGEIMTRSAMMAGQLTKENSMNSSTASLKPEIGGYGRNVISGGENREMMTLSDVEQHTKALREMMEFANQG